MKRLALFISIIISIQSFGQFDSTKLQPNYYSPGYKYEGLWPTKVLGVPVDTTYSKWGIARKGSTLYAGNGTYWTAVGGSSTLQQALTSSSILTGNNTIDGSGFSLTFNNFNSIKLTSAMGSGTSSDSLLVWNPVSGRIAYWNPNRIPAPTLQQVLTSGHISSHAMRITDANTFINEGTVKLYVYSDSVNFVKNVKHALYSRQDAGFTVAPSNPREVTAGYFTAFVDATNTQTWLPLSTSHPVIAAVRATASPLSGATGSVPKMASYYGTGGSTSGFTIDEFNLIDITYSHNGTITKGTGIKIQDIDAALNNTGIFITGSDFDAPPNGDWIIYDSVKYRTYLSRLYADTLNAYTFGRIPKLSTSEVISSGGSAPSVTVNTANAGASATATMLAGSNDYTGTFEVDFGTVTSSIEAQLFRFNFSTTHANRPQFALFYVTSAVGGGLNTVSFRIDLKNSTTTYVDLLSGANLSVLLGSKSDVWITYQLIF